MRYKRSSDLFRLAKKKIPGGVNSPVRAFKSVGGSPIFVKKAVGAYLYDEDNNRFIDYISSWGPMIIGHSNDYVIDAIANTAKKGTSFGIPTSLETEIAELVVSSVPNIDKIRFVNSGTEACMSAIRLARGFTKREKIIKFSGCYHGHSDSFLIQAGSGAATLNSPSSPGVTKGTVTDTLISDYNNIESDTLDIFSPYMLALRDGNQMGTMVDMSNAMLAIMGSVFLVIVMVVLWNMGLMNGLRRYGEVGLRLAIGEPKGHVYRSLILEAVIIGLFGTVVGTGLGLSITYYVQENGIDYTLSLIHI